MAKYDLTQDDQKVAFLKEATELVASLPGQVERQVYAIRTANTAGVGQDIVVAEVERRRKRLLAKARRNDEHALSRPEHASQPAAKALRYRDPVSAAAEEGIIRLLYLEPSLGNTDTLPDPDEFSSDALGKIYRLIREKISDGDSFSVGTMTTELSQDEMNLLVNILQKPEILSNGKRAMNDYIQKINEQKERNSPEDELDLNALRNRLRERKGYHP